MLRRIQRILQTIRKEFDTYVTFIVREIFFDEIAYIDIVVEDYCGLLIEYIPSVRIYLIDGMLTDTNTELLRQGILIDSTFHTAIKYDLKPVDVEEEFIELQAVHRRTSPEVIRERFRVNEWTLTEPTEYEEVPNPQLNSPIHRLILQDQTRYANINYVL